VPADLLGRVAPEDPDLEDVLAAAHLLRAPALLAVAASLLARRNRVLLPACPRPELPCDGSPDDVGRSIAAHLAGGRGWLAWTWAASLSGVGDAVWQAVLDADNPRNWVSLTTARLPWLARPLEIALVALGTRRPDRLAELRRRARPEALPFVDRADSALALFRSGLRGPLHPEIEALRRLVVPAGDKS
jgi:hypothetical protein